MKPIRHIFDKRGFPVIITVFTLLFLLETRHQLRKRTQSRRKRVWVNGTVAAPSFGFLRLVFLPATVWLGVRNRQWKLGISGLLKMPPALRFILSFLFLDYANYWWHILNHKADILWRFHNVHHTDLDLDVTTAIRFHFGEMIGSVFFRGAAVLLAGATPVTVLVYEIFFEAATDFHHSNWKLPLELEKALNKIIVTPRMHGIHHSIVERETNSNFSVIFSCWDRIHRTLRLNIAQEDITIGVPSYRSQDELTAANLLKMPFTKQRAWQLPDGTVPHRDKAGGPASGDSTTLLD